MGFDDRKRGGVNEAGYPSKRPKPELDPAQNPYLAHMYQDEDNGNYGRQTKGNRDDGSILSTFVRHKTTSEDATWAENGPANPFNGNPLSKQYFKILETRRKLPVHQQRWVSFVLIGGVCHANHFSQG